MRYVALLRGINVGGNNILKMADLAAIFSAADCEDVATYIQSGNVVFTATPQVAAKIALIVRAEVQAMCGFGCLLTLRSQPQMLAVLAANPFLQGKKPVTDEKQLHVAFLAEEPTPEQIATLDPNRSPGDGFRVVGSEVFLHMPNGMARTKITNQWLDSRLKTTSTVRNWNTVRKLAQMMAE